MRRALELFASLRVTVALFSFAMLLIFVGTIAQTQLGVWQAVELYFRSLIAWVDPGIFVSSVRGGSEEASNGFKIPIPGGLTITVLMMINLVAAHVLRFKATRKRVGVLVLHAGLIVLLVGELSTGFMSDEGLISIDEGSSSSFIEDIREVELAVIDPSDPEYDRVVTVPGHAIADAVRKGSAVVDSRLPFEVRVLEWMPNATLFHVNDDTLATDGIGLEARAEGRPRVAGVEGGQTDTPAAYVALSYGDQELGTWLVSAALIEAQRVEVGGVGYGLALRYRRTYLPFSLHLNDFRHDIFVGTSIAKNFSSDVRLVDPARQTDREVRIWMNNPLRYAGLTFYQASYKPDGSGTVLQVVRNPGWLLPYIACILVGGGMTLHFSQTLIGFLRRRAKHSSAIASEVEGSRRGKLWPWVVGACGVLIAMSALFQPQPKSEFDLEAFGQIPVSSGGRIKPLDTAARSMLMLAGGRQRIDVGEGKMPATEYLLNLVVNPNKVSGLPAIRVDQPEVLGLLDLSPEDGGRIALSVIEPKWAEITEQAQRASQVSGRERDGFQRAVLEFHHKVNTVLAHAQMREPFKVPPLGPDEPWRPFHEAFLDEHRSDQPHPSVAFLATMMSAASAGDVEGFNGAVSGYTTLLEASMPDVMRRMKIELLFNRASMFTGAIAVYLLAFLGVCASFVTRSRENSSQLAERLRVGSLALLISAVLVHTLAIVIRIYLQDRPPVTNLYSSAIFVGWAAALAGVFIERLYPLGVAILGSTTIGAATLIVAHNLGNDGDTMQMMQAVLDSNFWLATHVITITLGYSATFLAGAIAIVYVLGRLFTRSITREREQMLTRMTYGVVCFAMLLSFVGTVLGGIWADQSWGRFWGWDPKENGALLIVLWLIWIQHGRLSSHIKPLGFMALMAGLNIIVALAWFGVNLLSVGLHSYGFTSGIAEGLLVFCIAEIILITALTLKIKRQTA
ncbi:MAG: cytochrome c biogenesis protein CcsA [Planctomycetota bacterium]